MTDNKETVQVTKEIPKGKLTFGNVNNPTPMWATWLFRIEFVASKAVLMWITATTLITNPTTVKELVLILTVIDFATWGFGRLIGVKKADYEE